MKRRDFLRLSTTVAVGGLLAACAAPATPSGEAPAGEAPAAPTTAPTGGEAPTRYAEAPMFAEKTAKGELPAVEDRLPKEPQIVTPLERVGDYGGTLHVTTIRAEGYGDDTVLMGCEGIFRTDTDGSSVAPNIAKAWEFSEDGKEFTIFLREGLKWSDGAPVTADDFMFAWDAVYLNTEITPTLGKWWKPGGETIKIEKVDDFTVKVTSVVPNPELLAWGGGPIRGDNALLPKHALMQYHADYAKVEDLTKAAKEAGFEFWYQLFNEKRRRIWGTQLNDACPTLGSYLITERSSERRTYIRNPYFWKVDTAGNQLPYIDNIIATILSDKELVNTAIVGGTVDIVIQEASMENYPLYQDNAEKGQYSVNIWKSVLGSDVIYQPAQTYNEDIVLRDIYRDVRFRKALSLAINRAEVNEVLYFGMGTPRQFTVIPQSSYFLQEFSDAYAEYDVDAANALLDEMGLEWDANKEFRLRPDGKQLGWTIEFFQIETPKRATTELVVDYWKKIGCNVQFKEISGELDTERYTGNLVEFGLWHGDKVTDVLFSVSPQFLVPYNVGWETCWGVEWARWYTTEGAEGEEPPEDVKNLTKWWEELQMTVDPAKRVEVGRNILRSQAENLWVIGVVGLSPKPVIVKNNIGNFVKEGLHGWDVVWTCYTHPESFFFEGGKSLVG
ncbi:MAG: ABC transporter substrate-binding protein [Chloroflexi bacterium]|nr:ABC transporter substrate-binding protein [Chloroflexota bacterium]